MPHLIVSITFLASIQNPADIEHFEKRVRPLLAERCWKCHGPETARSGLRLDSAKGLAAGGKRGIAVIPSNPDASPLLLAVQRKGELKMPPDGPLNERQVADLSRWIKAGANFPSVETARADEGGHWAFQPLGKVIPPGKGHPVDELVNPRLLRDGLKPSDMADASALVRRATIDLTGLPPSPEAIKAFLADRSAEAWPRLVDRLLASSAYGERWGRHWLDVARYADSNGLDENVAHGNAWRYRDYVVGAFNTDMPFNRFIREQVAGDLLEGGGQAEKHRMLVATGFLAIGPKVLAEVDKKKLEMDIIDEQVETTGKAFLGMTLGCARCHDHKFDPVSTADYYAMAGIFKSTKTMDDLKTIAKWHENEIPNPEEARRHSEHQSKIAKAKAAAEDFITRHGARLRGEGKLPGESKPAAKEVETRLDAGQREELARLRSALSELEKASPELPSAMGVADSSPVNLAIHLRGSTERLGAVVPRGVPKVLSRQWSKPFPEKTSGRIELAEWLASDQNPLTARVIVNRVWRWHFGSGIVPSVDNFGLLGEKPTNPELLDWLAAEFIRNGWSLKKLHRLILTSETYRRSTAISPDQARLDPSGRLWSRWIPRRMEAEAIRDSMLEVSGLLDKTMGGSLLTVKNREFFFNHTSRDLTKYDFPRRSLYLPVVRNNLYDVVQLFDGTDASVANGDRATTTIATQALFFLNSPLVLQCSKALAKRSAADAADTDGQIRRMHELALGRMPTSRESQRAKEFIRDATTAGGPDQTAALAGFAQILLSSNEFVTIR